VSEAAIPPCDDRALPVASLHRWLTGALPSLVSGASTITVEQFPAGFSNLTYRVDVDHGRRTDSLVLRRPPPGVAGGVAHDMVREYGILEALQGTGVPVPTPRACCADPAVIGAPFYVMELVEGRIVRGSPPRAWARDAEGLAVRMRQLSHAFATTLAALHAVPVQGALASLGRPQGYVARQVDGWSRRWTAARTHDVPAMDRLASWLAAHQPVTGRVALLHNDFKIDNLVLDEEGTTVRAILDWEMATIGDPLLDLGTSLAYWVEAGDPPLFAALGLGVTALPGSLTRRELIEAYGQAVGEPEVNARFALCFGRFKVAVIAQQIYARYRQGHTTDQRFALLGDVVQALATLAEQELEGS
jgi:aminoglycoside phosphotransferase (APT) family kinase protein